jgi:hypothetical protein
MYCPKCSQEQALEQQRFCSRCGFPLSGIAELVAGDGLLPVPESAESIKRRSPRYEGVRQGVILLMLAIVLLPLVDVIGRPYHEALIFMFLLAGVMRTVYALIYQEGGAKRHSGASELGGSQSAKVKLRSGKDAAALPPAVSTPVADFISTRKETTEVAGRFSVTENTTKLLDSE